MNRKVNKKGETLMNYNFGHRFYNLQASILYKRLFEKFVEARAK